MVLHLFRILTRGFARAGTVTLPARTYAHSHTRSLWPARSLSLSPSLANLSPSARTQTLALTLGFKYKHPLSWTRKHTKHSFAHSISFHGLKSRMQQLRA